MERLTQQFLAISELSALVKRHNFVSGSDNGRYFNFTFGTVDAQSLWQTIQERIYRSSDFGLHMSCASMAMCSAEDGWDTYLQLFHYDQTVPIDDPAF